MQQVASPAVGMLRLGRAVGRCLQLGRQLEMQHAELTGAPQPRRLPRHPRPRKEDHRALVRSTQYAPVPARATVRLVRPRIRRPRARPCRRRPRTAPGQHVDRIERSVRRRSERIIREFSPGPLFVASTSSGPTFTQMEEIRACTVSALTALSPLPRTSLLRQAAGRTSDPGPDAAGTEVYLRSALRAVSLGWRVGWRRCRRSTERFPRSRRGVRM